jgi:hypothetical protein
MILWASGCGMGVGRFSRPSRGVGVQAMPDDGTNTMLCVGSRCMVALRAGVLTLHVAGMAVEVIHHRGLVARIEVAH